MKNIMVLVHDDDGQEARLQTALDLTRALDGHLSCVDVTVLPMIVADFYGTADQAMLAADVKDREEKHKSAIQERLAHEDVQWDWTDIIGNMVPSVLEAATLADLIVLNSKLEGFPDPDMHNIASSIVMRAHAPILTAPAQQKRLGMDRALVAWDGSPSSASALRASVPLLRLAKEVRLFTAQDKSEGVAPEAAARYLSRHDIHANVETMGLGPANADELIAAEAARWKVDYIVMGAYGHGRLRETFGGVTKRMLANSTLPLMLAH